MRVFLSSIAVALIPAVGGGFVLTGFRQPVEQVFATRACGSSPANHPAQAALPPARE